MSSSTTGSSKQKINVPTLHTPSPAGAIGGGNEFMRLPPGTLRSITVVKTEDTPPSMFGGFVRNIASKTVNILIWHSIVNGNLEEAHRTLLCDLPIDNNQEITLTSYNWTAFDANFQTIVNVEAD